GIFGRIEQIAGVGVVAVRGQDLTGKGGRFGAITAIDGRHRAVDEFVEGTALRRTVATVVHPVILSPSGGEAGWGRTWCQTRMTLSPPSTRRLSSWTTRSSSSTIQLVNPRLR